MATSGSTDFNVTRNDIINGALRALRLVSSGETAEPQEITDASEALNMLVKQWQGKADFAPGLKVWTRTRGVVFLEKGKSSYQLGVDQATTSHVETACKVAAVATDSTIDVDSITGISASDYICIVMDDGNLHTTTVNGAPSGDTVTLTDQLTAAVSVDNQVWTYTTKMQQPLKILTAYLRDSEGDDTPLDVDMTLEEYESLPDKDVDGEPCQFYFEKSRTDATLYLDTAVEDVTDVLHVTFYRPIEDFDNATDDADYPQQWFRALKFGLALDIAPEYGIEPLPNVVRLASESLAIAQNVDLEQSDVFYEPEYYGD